MQLLRDNLTLWTSDTVTADEPEDVGDELPSETNGAGN